MSKRGVQFDKAALDKEPSGKRQKLARARAPSVEPEVTEEDAIAFEEAKQAEEEQERAEATVGYEPNGTDDADDAEKLAKAQADMDSELDAGLAAVAEMRRNKSRLPLAPVVSSSSDAQQATSSAHDAQMALMDLGGVEMPEDEIETQEPAPLPRNLSTNDAIDISFGFKSSEYYFSNIDPHKDIIWDNIGPEGKRFKDNNDDLYIRPHLAWLANDCPILGPFGVANFPRLYPYGNLQGYTDVPQPFDAATPEKAEYFARFYSNGWNALTGAVYREQEAFQNWLPKLDSSYQAAVLRNKDWCKQAKLAAKTKMIEEFDRNIEMKTEFLRQQARDGVKLRKEDLMLISKNGKRPTPTVEDFTKMFLRCCGTLVKYDTKADGQMPDVEEDGEPVVDMDGAMIEHVQKPKSAKKYYINIRGKVFRRVPDKLMNKINTLKAEGPLESRLLRRPIDVVNKIYPLILNEVPMQCAHTMQLIPKAFQTVKHTDVIAPVFFPKPYISSPNKECLTGLCLVPRRIYLLQVGAASGDASQLVSQSLQPISIKGSKHYDYTSRRSAIAFNQGDETRMLTRD